MTKIPFDIKFRPQIESGEYKVVTRLDTPVKIFCYDARGKYPIAGLVRGDESDCAQTWRIDGSFDCRNESSFDLFLSSDEPELTEFEQVLLEIAHRKPEEATEIELRGMRIYRDQLLALARNEIVKSGYAIIEGEHYLDEGRKNYERGKAEALKDLPRWKKANGKERFNERLIVLAVNNDLLCTNYAEEGEYYISFSDLEKLPKEDGK